MKGRTAALVWVVTRMAVLAMLFTYAADVVSDVNYYHQSLAALGDGGLRNTLVEYPLPAVGVVAVPWLLSGGSSGGAGVYVLVFLLLALGADASMMRLLLRQDSQGRSASVAWLLLVPALGALTYLRFDLVPGVLVAVALLVHRRSPRTAAVAVAVATCVKLWPVLLVAPVLAASRARGRLLALVAAIGATAAGFTVALSGWERLLSPLTYQGDRGLQIESVAATPAMVLHALHAGASRVWFAPSRSWEVSGPVADTMLTATTVLTACLALALVLTWWLVLRRPSPVGPDTLVWLTLASISGFIVLGRVLSPQYLLWLIPAAAAGLAVAGATRRALARWTAGLGVAALLTNVLYPSLYRPLLRQDAWSTASLTVLTVRNVVLVALLIGAAVMTWRSATGRISSVASQPDAGSEPLAAVLPERPVSR